MAIIKGDVGAVNILKDVLTISQRKNISRILLTLGPTTPFSLRPPHGSRILWATFNDGPNLNTGPHLIVVPPTNLTDMSLSLEKLSVTRSGRIPLIVGDFLDNVLSVATSPPGLYAFLCKLFTRIRTYEQTAFFVATEDMHDPKNTAILKRFADVIIEYRSVQEDSGHRLEARILDHAENHYRIWDSNENAGIEDELQTHDEISLLGRQRTPTKQLREPIMIPS
jgi:hypothetical protein